MTRKIPFKSRLDRIALGWPVDHGHVWQLISKDSGVRQYRCVICGRVQVFKNDKRGKPRNVKPRPS